MPLSNASSPRTLYNASSPRPLYNAPLFRLLSNASSPRPLSEAPLQRLLYNAPLRCPSTTPPLRRPSPRPLSGRVDVTTGGSTCLRSAPGIRDNNLVSTARPGL